MLVVSKQPVNAPEETAKIKQALAASMLEKDLSGRDGMSKQGDRSTRGVNGGYYWLIEII